MRWKLFSHFHSSDSQNLQPQEKEETIKSLDTTLYLPHSKNEDNYTSLKYVFSINKYVFDKRSHTSLPKMSCLNFCLQALKKYS